MFVMVEAAVFECEGCDVPCRFSECNDDGFCRICVARGAPSKHAHLHPNRPVASRPVEAYRIAAGGFQTVSPKITSFRS